MASLTLADMKVVLVAKWAHAVRKVLLLDVCLASRILQDKILSKSVLDNLIT